MSRRSDLLSRPAGEAGRARSGPCSGSWCWWRRRVSGAGEGAADSCGGSEGHTSRTGEQWGPQIRKKANDKIFFDFYLFFFLIFFQCVCDSQCKASLRCECAGGSSGSAGGGSGCHRCGKGTASPRYGSERGPWGGQPKARTNSHSQVKICNKKKNVSFNPQTWQIDAMCQVWHV